MIMGAYHKTISLRNRDAMPGRIEALAILKPEYSTVFQHIGRIKQIDVIVPLGDAESPVLHIVDKIDVQCVPLAIFPVTHLHL